MRPNHGMDLIHDTYAKPQPIDLFDWVVVSSIISMSYICIINEFSVWFWFVKTNWSTFVIFAKFDYNSLSNERFWSKSINLVCPICNNKLWIMLPINRSYYDFIWIDFRASLSWSTRGMNRLLWQYNYNDLIMILFGFDHIPCW
jgi:hypothetical protein